MGTELAAVAAGGPPPSLSPETLERLVVHGDLSQLTPKQKVEYYVARCRAAGLDPATKPFEYLVLKGKHVLYATKACTDQLSGLHKLNVEITDRTLNKDFHIFQVQCKVTFPTGRKVDDMAAVDVRGLGGEALANALMKCVTKAKRRTILSACGLGMLDETEVDAIEGAQRVPLAEVHDADEGTTQLVDPRTLKSTRSEGVPGGKQGNIDMEAASRFMREVCAEVNAEWADYWSERYGAMGVPSGFPDSCIDVPQLSGHMSKFFGGPKTQNYRHRSEFLGMKLREEREAFEAEAREYARREKAKAIDEKEREFESIDGPGADDDEDAKARAEAEAWDRLDTQDAEIPPGHDQDNDGGDEAYYDRQAARDADPAPATGRKAAKR